jgi:dUTP pyrophosphatase
MILKIFVRDNQLKEKYRNAIANHNHKINDQYPDAGFDLFCPSDITVYPNDTTCKVDLGVKCSAYDMANGNNISYYLYPRSSISKTVFRMANSVGIIDSGYRGNIRCVLDKVSTEGAKIEKHARYFQICSPTLSPVKVVLVDSVEELGMTSRGSGGFGSTGR